MNEFHISYVLESIPQILTAFWLTLELAVGTLALSLLFGAAIAVVKLSGNRILKGIADGYTAVIRCTPTVILLFLCYYGLPKLFLPFCIDIDDMDQFFYCLIAFTLLNGAMTSEMIRSTWQAIDRGQFEAAAMCGLSSWQAAVRIALPQGLYIALPNLGNLMITLLKETSLGFTIGLIDMMGKAKLIISLHYGNRALETYLGMTIIYWVLTILIEQAEKRLEKRFRFGRKVAAG